MGLGIPTHIKLIEWSSLPSPLQLSRLTYSIPAMSQETFSNKYEHLRKVENAQALTSSGDESDGDGDSEGVQVERHFVASPSFVIEEPLPMSLKPSIASIAKPNKSSRRRRFRSQNAASHRKQGFASQNMPSSKRRLFGVNRAAPPDKQSNSASTFNRFDYEQKYAKDRFGEELGPNARVWLTYLDEADAYDRDKVEGWRETVDVLLVFTGLFSAIVTTFLSRASQSLQQDYTQVSASLLFEMVQLQRAQFAGVPLSNVPNSTLTPTSPFNPSTTASLVNGLWFASLTISLSTALFSVLAKQWLYYYLSAVPGTARDKARVRQFRFQGLESWKVGFIIDLLPILLHIALVLFLVGLVILVLPLDIRIAWVVVVLSGITYTLYAISVALPIWHAQCPYTTSLTIFFGTMYHFLVPISFTKSMWRGHKHPFITKASAVVSQVIQLYPPVHNAGRVVFKLVLAVQRGMLGRTKRLRQHLTNALQWRQIKLNESIRTAKWLNLKALYWLHTISTNPSIQRIIARSRSVYPESIEESRLEFSLYTSIFGSTPEGGVEDYCHVLVLRIQRGEQWLKPTLTFLANASVDGKGDSYTSCIKVARGMLRKDHVGILQEAFEDPHFRAPFIIWRYLLSSANTDAELAAHILRHPFNSFEWPKDDDSTIVGSSLISVSDQNTLGKLKIPCFQYLFRCFCGNELLTDEATIFSENHYRLFLAIYRNLTSDQPFIQNQMVLKDCLEKLFRKLYQAISRVRFHDWTEPWKYLHGFSKDILRHDAFWGEQMAGARVWAMGIFDVLWKRDSEDTGDVLHLLSSADDDQELRCIYRWCSQEFLQVGSAGFSTVVLLLFVPQNLKALTTILCDGPQAQAVSDFRRCLRHLRRVSSGFMKERIKLERRYIFPHLCHLFKTMSQSDPLFTIIHDKSILVQLWAYFSERNDIVSLSKEFVDIIKLKMKLNSQDLEELYELMVAEALIERHELVLYKSAHRFGRMIGVPISKFTSSVATQWTHLLGLKQHFQSAAEMFEAFNRELDKDERKCSHTLFPLIDRVREIFKKSQPRKASDKEGEV